MKTIFVISAAILTFTTSVKVEADTVTHEQQCATYYSATSSLMLLNVFNLGQSGHPMTSTNIEKVSAIATQFQDMAVKLAPDSNDPKKLHPTIDEFTSKATAAIYKGRPGNTVLLGTEEYVNDLLNEDADCIRTFKHPINIDTVDELQVFPGSH